VDTELQANMTNQRIVDNLKGIFPPVVTPFNRRGDVDEKQFRENLQKYAGTGLGGVVVAGSTGEALLLNEAERLRLVEIARDVVCPPELLLVGTGLESTRETIRLSREVIARGADALLVLPPHYYKPKMDAPALIAHFEGLASRVKRPVILYSIPQFTGINMEAETIAALSRHANIVGLKESSGDLAFVKTILRRAAPGFRVLVGAAAILLQALRAGAAGAVLGQACFAPELCVGVYEAFRRGQTKTARELQQRLLPLAQKISVPFGVSGIKAALDFTGYRGGLPRSPLLPLSAESQRVVSAAVKEARAGLEL
jgi:4-hydroxy-2-oxoglutarate aldolase